MTARLVVFAFLLSTFVSALTACDKSSIGNGGYICGDGICEGNEDHTTCPEDCYCGNGTCEESETPESCPEDCAVCGDGECHGPVENCETCPEDCGECPVCGNDEMEEGEECDGDDLGGLSCEDLGFSGGELSCTEECLLDTSSCLDSSCGNDVCETFSGETCGNCPEDCSCGEAYCIDFITCVYGCDDMQCAEACHFEGCEEAQDNSVLILMCIEDSCNTECTDPGQDGCHTCIARNCGVYLAACYQSVCPGTCGDGVCDPDEDHVSCPEDCSECGNGICERDETAETCADDCEPGCGDGYCDVDETCETCPNDCGVCPPTCGDGVCNPVLGESCATCPSDCECGTATCSQVLECLNSCGQDQGCVNDCFETGCYEAQLEAQALYSCLLTSCAIECGTDPEGAGCMQCMIQECGAEAQACANGTCST